MRNLRKIPALTTALLASAFVAGPGQAGETVAEWTWERTTTCLTTVAGDLDGPAGGARCVGDQMGGALLDKAIRFMNQQGKATFGENFRLVHRMTWAPFGNGLAGNLDMVVPLAATGGADVEALDGSAFFLQHGVTRWTDKHGFQRNDLRLGTAYRFALPGFAGTGADVFGVSALVQENIERGHQRLVLGTDYASGWGVAELHHYIPTTDWRRGRSGYEERAAGGTELNLRFDLTSTLSFNTAVGRWERDGIGRSTVDGRLGFGWRPHPYVRLHARAGVGPDADSGAFRLSLNVPFDAPRRLPGWEGLGAFGMAATSRDPDIWRPVENVGRIQTVERASQNSTQGTGGISVRFLQSAAESGDEIALEVSLSAPASEDVRLSVRLVPGSGDNPAVPGVDYVDESEIVTIRRGSSSERVTFQLLDNPGLDSDRTLSVEVTRTS